MSDLHEKLKARIAELGTNESAVSRAAGLDKTYLRKLFERPGSVPKSDTLQKIAKALDLSLTDLLSDGLTDGSGPVPGKAATDVKPADVDFPYRESMPKDVPVMGTSAGSLLRGAFQLEGGAIDYARRPPGLVGAKDIYALYVEGTSMSPKYEPGDICFVNPHRPARIGDVVIVQFQGGPADPMEASIGYYQQRTAEYFNLGKINPQATVKLDLSKVVAVHRVVPVNELFGI